MEEKLIMTKNEHKLRYAKPWSAIWYFCGPMVLIMVRLFKGYIILLIKIWPKILQAQILWSVLILMSIQQII